MTTKTELGDSQSESEYAKWLRQWVSYALGAPIPPPLPSAAAIDVEAWLANRLALTGPDWIDALHRDYRPPGP